MVTGFVFNGLNPVNAEEVTNNFNLDEYVVTATRNMVKTFEANANISVITKRDIEDKHYENVKEAIENIPGVNISSYGLPGHTTSDSILINGSNKVLLLVDGMRMNQGAESNLYELFNDMANIERIEILRGSASSLYGADAQGGVINVITNKMPAYESKLSIAGGSFDNLSTKLSTQGNSKDWGYRIAIGKDKIGNAKDGDGNEIKQSNDARNINMMVSKKLGENGDKGILSFAYDKFSSDYTYQDPWEDKSESGEYQTESYRLLLDYDFEDSLKNRFSIVRNQRILKPSWGNTNIVSFGISEQITKNFNDKNILTGGVDYHNDKFVEGYTGYGSSQYGNMNGTVLKNTAVYIQDIHNFDEKWNLTLGGRFDNNNLFDDKVTGNAKIGYKFNDDTNTYISYATFFNTPNLYSLYSGEHGNSNLKPENGDNVEIGLNHKVDDSMIISSHLFKRNTSDKIVYNNVTEKYENLNNDEKAHGFDIQIKKNFSDKFSTTAAYTYLKTDADGNINNYGYLPKHTIDLGIDYNINKLSANINVRGIIDRPGYEVPADKGSNFPEDTYWLVNVGLNYKADKEHKFYFKVNNLFDKLYAEQSNVNWGGAEQWWTMPGRSFLVGMEYTF